MFPDDFPANLVDNSVAEKVGYKSADQIKAALSRCYGDALNLHLAMNNLSSARMIQRCSGISIAAKKILNIEQILYLPRVAQNYYHWTWDWIDGHMRGYINCLWPW